MEPEIETIAEEMTEKEETNEEKDEDEEAVEKKEDDKKSEHEDDEEGEGEGEAEMKVEVAKPPIKGGKPRKLTNQFNFCERAALTYNNPTRVSINRITSTSAKS